jgi:DNA-binding response OmpR family regulator
MALIVVCEDDASTRALITAVLNTAGHQVEAFDNGLKGYSRLLEGDAELLISDVRMPGQDGFELVTNVRKNKKLMEIPCILLTSLQERADMRTGMTSGADDYVTKPFQPVELLDAVNSQLKRAMQLHILHVDETLRSVDAALGDRINALTEQYEKRLQQELQSRWARTDTSSTELRGSLLLCSFLQQEAWLQALSSTEMADLARHFFNKVADSASVFHADHVQFMGDGLLIVFDQSADSPSMQHTSRACRMVQAMRVINASVQSYAREKYSGSALPEFSSSLAVHEGALGLGKLDGLAGGLEQIVPVGQDMQVLGKLSKAGQMLRWQVLISQEALNSWITSNIDSQVLDKARAKLQDQSLMVYRVQ